MSNLSDFWPGMPGGGVPANVLDVVNRLLKDQFGETAINFASDSQSDSTTLLKADADFGWVTINNGTLYIDSAGEHGAALSATDLVVQGNSFASLFEGTGGLVAQANLADFSATSNLFGFFNNSPEYENSQLFVDVSSNLYIADGTNLGNTLASWQAQLCGSGLPSGDPHVAGQPYQDTVTHAVFVSQG